MKLNLSQISNEETVDFPKITASTFEGLLFLDSNGSVPSFVLKHKIYNFFLELTRYC